VGAEQERPERERLAQRVAQQRGEQARRRLRPDRADVNRVAHDVRPHRRDMRDRVAAHRVPDPRHVADAVAVGPRRERLGLFARRERRRIRALAEARQIGRDRLDAERVQRRGEAREVRA